MVFGDRGIGKQILTLGAAEAILFLFVNQFALQILAVPHSATPQRNIGWSPVVLERANDLGRAVAAIGDCLTNGDLVADLRTRSSCSRYGWLSCRAPVVTSVSRMTRLSASIV